MIQSLYNNNRSTLHWASIKESLHQTFRSLFDRRAKPEAFRGRKSCQDSILAIWLVRIRTFGRSISAVSNFPIRYFHPSFQNKKKKKSSPSPIIALLRVFFFFFLFFFVIMPFWSGSAKSNEPLFELQRYVFLILWRVSAVHKMPASIWCRGIST